MGVTFDAGALVAVDPGELRVWEGHRAILFLPEVPTTPAPVVAQAWRGGSRQALLARWLVGSDIEPTSDTQARAVGVLAGWAGAIDVVDATIAEGALRRHNVVISSDPGHLKAIADSANRRLEVERL